MCVWGGGGGPRGKLMSCILILIVYYFITAYVQHRKYGVLVTLKTVLQFRDHTIVQLF